MMPSAAGRLEVRAARSADVHAVLAVNREGRPGVAPLDAAEVEARLAAAGVLAVAEAAGRVVGYRIAWGREAGDPGEEFARLRELLADFVYVDQVAVAAGARRLGVAGALYAALERDAAAAGRAAVACEVNLRPPNPASLAFHAARGYEPLGELEVRDGRLVSLLVKPLAGR